MRGPCWTLNHATDGIGREYPQHQRMAEAHDFDAPTWVSRWPDDTVPDFEPDLGTAVVHGHARLTDLVSSGSYGRKGYLLSGRLRTVFERFRLPTHRFYPVRVVHRRKPADSYFWLHLPGPQLDIPDGASVEEAEAAVLTASGPDGFDLLRLFRPSRFAYCYVSDPLRRAVEAAGITGVRFGTAKLFRRPASGAASDLHAR